MCQRDYSWNSLIEHILKVGAIWTRLGKSYNDAMRSYESRLYYRPRQCNQDELKGLGAKTKVDCQKPLKLARGLID